MIQALSTWAHTNWRGLACTLTIGAAALFISEHYGGPQVLYAMLIGMALHFLSDEPTAKPGIFFSSKVLLQIGVALLGVRIGIEQLEILTPQILLLIVSGVFLTVLISLVFNRFTHWPKAEAALAGASVAVCGASAAAALSLVIDKSQLREKALLTVIVTVVTLSTIAMILYPMLIELLGFAPTWAGILIGGTIHDVAQVVGAGSLLGQEALETGTMVKMLRISMLVPMICLFTLLYGEKTQERKGRSLNLIKQIPLFLFGFVLLAFINVLGLIPSSLSKVLSDISQLCILISIGALGIRTSLGELKTVGWAPVILMTIDTVFLLLWVIIGLYLFG